MINMIISAIIIITVMTDSRCVLVFGLNATRVSSEQGESHTGGGEA